MLLAYELHVVRLPMSLRQKIIARILISTLCMLVLGGALAIWQARQSIAKEVDASIHLALQLVTLGVSDAPVFQEADDLSHFSALHQTRHLSIQLQKPNGQLIQFAGDKLPSNPKELPPLWFIHLVQSDFPIVKHEIKTKKGDLLILLIQAQPLDEITEAWQESVEFFVSILLLTILTFVAVNMVFRKSFTCIGIIVDALAEIESGQYQQPIPTFAIAEFDKIATAVNHMMLELENTRQENRALTQHTLAIQEDERQRLSQELHDELGQSLTAIKVMAGTVAHPKADINKISSSITSICNHLMNVVRSMMQQLHPLVLTELGLKATLEDLAHHWSERNPELAVIISCHDEVDYLDKSIAIQVFRIIQECLTNVIRHSEAQQVTINLEFQELPKSMLLLKVQDNGQGCNLSLINHGFGFLGMKERVKSLNGDITIQSKIGEGMTLSAWIPLS